MTSRRLAGLVVVGGLCFPFLVLLYFFDLRAALDVPEFLWALKNSLGQSVLSATTIVLAGLGGARGILCLSGGWRRSYEIALLLPNFLPALFTLLVLLNLIEPYPMGIAGISLAHLVMNWGLASVLIAVLLERKIGGLAEVAWVEGWRGSTFWWRGVLPLLVKDLAYIWVFFFAVCFSSFSVPLIVGGVRGTTLEVLIYEKIRLSADWAGAVHLAALQSVFLFLIAWIVSRGAVVPRGRVANLSLLRSRAGLAMGLGLSCVWFWGYLRGALEGWNQIDYLFELSGQLLGSLAGSLIVSMVSGGLALGGLILLMWVWPLRWFENFLSGYVAPSQALAGFAFLVITPNEGWWPYIKIPLVLVTLYLTSLWRMGWQSELDGLSGQRDVARTLGASESMIRWKIIWPQASERAGILAGIVAIWAAGDFALSRVLAHRDLTLAMMTESLMSGYRLGLATLLSMGVIGVAGLAFVFVKGVARVLGGESRS